jgi:hypothetical protein
MIWLSVLLVLCAIESSSCADPRCYGASMGFEKGLLCGSCVIKMKSQVYSWTSRLYQQLNELRGVPPSGTLLECGNSNV